jgi:histidyl-tRNA synthetase
MKIDVQFLPDIKLESTVKGTRLIMGDLAKKRRLMINDFIGIAEGYGFMEIVLPVIEKSSVYTEKAGSEILSQMYVFNDRGGRELCLRPEGTATCQLLADERLKYEKNVKLFYVTNCYRYENPQAGRYREFCQFGVEILNPTMDYNKYLQVMAEEMVKTVTDKYELNESVKRGLAYYTTEGFEIACPELGAQKQVCGGGTYKQGIGFALGVDRLLLLKNV